MKMQTYVKVYLPTILAMVVFITICALLIVFRQQGFLLLDQRGIFFEYAYNPTSTLFGNTIEYPIGAWFFFRAVRLWADTFQSLFASLLQAYYFFFSLSIVLIYSLMWGSLILYTQTKQVKKQVVYAILFFAFFFAANPYLCMSTFDMLPTLMSFLALLLLKKYPRLSSSLLAVATTVKWFPAVLLPLFLFFIYKEAGKKMTIEYGVFFTGVTLAIILVGQFFIPLSTQKQSFTFHSERGVHIESTYANILSLSHTVLGQTPLKSVYAYHSYQIEGPGVSSVQKFTLPLLLLSLAIIFSHAIRRYRSEISTSWITTYSLILIMAFFLFNKVFSGQFVFWAWPFFLLFLSFVQSKKKWIAIGAYMLSACLYPFLIFFQIPFIQGHLALLFLLTLRNSALFGVFFWCWQKKLLKNSPLPQA